MNDDKYYQYIRYFIILVLAAATAAATAGVVWLVQWMFALDFSKDDLERIFWTLLGLLVLGVAVPGAAAFKAVNKDDPNHPQQ